MTPKYRGRIYWSLLVSIEVCLYIFTVVTSIEVRLHLYESGCNYGSMVVSIGVWLYP